MECHTQTKHAAERTQPAAASYPLPAQSFHHSIQTIVGLGHSGADAGGGWSTVQLDLKFNNLTVKRLILLLETTGLKDTERD